jgi:hypothetical protein
MRGTPSAAQDDDAAGRPVFAIGDGARRVTNSRELAELLRARLRFLSMWSLLVWGLLLLLVLVRFWRQVVADPAASFTRPPLLGYFPLVFSGFALVAYATRGTAAPSLARLRALEWLLFGPGCIWVAAMWALQLRLALPEVGRIASLIALASAGFWLVAFFAYAVLIPNEWRRSARAMALLLALGLLPDGVVLLLGDVAAAQAAYYLGLKAITLGTAAILAIYGAHRIDVLQEDARQARELGQYTLIERIGGGGMGEVYRAAHRFLRRPCAVKLIRPDLEAAPGLLERFEREVQATSNLTHPNTIQVFDYGRTDDGTFYYVMEYLDGESVDQLVERAGALPPARVVHLLAQVCEALHEAHQQGLVHRDIKPGNIVVCTRGGVPDVAKVLDFGLVAPIVAGVADARLTQAGTLLGTPLFMSPEQIAGSDVGPRSDIYSLGAVAWLMLSGTPLFDGRGVAQLLAAHLVEPIPALSSAERPVPSSLEAVISRCLAKAPEDRFATALELRDALRAA